MKWKKEEIDYLSQSYASEVPISEIMAELDRTKRAVCHKAVRLGLFRPRLTHNRPKNVRHREIYDRNYYLRFKEKIYRRKRNRIINYKREVVNLLGGKCQNCGYSKCLAAFDFHHKELNKEEDISIMLNNNSKEKILKEAEKCILLCANCHRELHNKDL